MPDMFLLIKDGPKGESVDSTLKAPNMVVQGQAVVCHLQSM